MRNIKITFFAIVALLAFGSASAQSFNAHWDSCGTDLGRNATITIGDQLEVVLSMPVADFGKASFPPYDFFSQNDILALSQRLDTIAADDGSNWVRQHVLVTCFDPGEHALGIDSIADSLRLSVLDVANVDTTKADIKDIASVFREPYTFWEIFRWVLLAISVAAIVAAAIVAIKKMKRHEPIVTLRREPPMPPKEKALQELEELRRKELWKQGLVKEFHTALTDILRDYLKARYGISSAEMTSDETLEAFRCCAGWSSLRDDLLRRVLRTADMVKFAKADPPSTEHSLSMEQATEFVNREEPETKNEEQNNPIQTTSNHE